MYVFITSFWFPNEYKWIIKSVESTMRADSRLHYSDWKMCMLMHVNVFVMTETAIGNHIWKANVWETKRARNSPLIAVTMIFNSIRIVIVTDHYCDVTICKYISFSIMWYNVLLCVWMLWVLLYILYDTIRYGVGVGIWCDGVSCDMIFRFGWLPKLMVSSYVNYTKMSRI